MSIHQIHQMCVYIRLRAYMYTVYDWLWRVKSNLHGPWLNPNRQDAKPTSHLFWSYFWWNYNRSENVRNTGHWLHSSRIHMSHFCSVLCSSCYILENLNRWSTENGSLQPRKPTRVSQIFLNHGEVLYQPCHFFVSLRCKLCEFTNIHRDSDVEYGIAVCAQVWEGSQEP